MAKTGKIEANCHQNIGSVYIGLREIRLSVFRKLCPVAFLIVGKCSVLLQSIVMSYVDCGDDG